MVVCDNAWAHLADAVVNGYVGLGIRWHYIAKASPWEQGKTEAFVDTFTSEFLATLPGYTHHNDLRFRKPLWTNDELLTIEELSLKTAPWIDHYDVDRKHESLGMAPIQAWQDDPTPLEWPDPDLIRRYFVKHGRTNVITANGVSFKPPLSPTPLWYQSNDFAGKRGRRVQIRFLPQDPTQIDVYHLNGEYLTTARHSPTMLPEERAALRRNRTNRIGRIDHLIKTSRVRAVEREIAHPDPDAFGDMDDTAPSAGKNDAVRPDAKDDTKRHPDPGGTFDAQIAFISRFQKKKKKR